LATDHAHRSEFRDLSGYAIRASNRVGRRRCEHPNALFGFFGGAIADAVGPRRAMFWCDVHAVIVARSNPAVLNAPLAVIFALRSSRASVCDLRASAWRGRPALLQRDHLAQGNSLVYASDALWRLAARSPVVHSLSR